MLVLCVTYVRAGHEISLRWPASFQTRLDVSPSLPTVPNSIVSGLMPRTLCVMRIGEARSKVQKHCKRKKKRKCNELGMQVLPDLPPIKPLVVDSLCIPLLHNLIPFLLLHLFCISSGIPFYSVFSFHISFPIFLFCSRGPGSLAS